MACYCISHKEDVRSETDEPSSSMELDAALHELGMLSKITDSRTDFIQEKMLKQKKKVRYSNSLSSAPLCVVQMNSKFITKFSLSSKNFQSDSEDEKTDGPTVSDDLLVTPNFWIEPSTAKQSRLKAMSPRQRRKLARCQPYDPCYRNHRASHHVIPDVEDCASSPAVVSRQDSGGNKSNPSSPAKSQNSHPKTPSLVRSRSLDDLEIAKVDESPKEDCYCRYGRLDIETVSQRISKLNVS
ncbi:hypothetical protein JTE90_006682 [Oedothorax gibbosus]|uniref:Uncharacterized protein n=1 Tax=Oedothorax gibbosus TaxID=931172 RepID=A0AAV6V1M5_9ARAC|nr:hypothetical protein JTE90_006682 [Oedothorax gibbosus]